tara:strand:+ start:50 stop:391 length:342 start_codon:yes stop_codon:yes gene_type:complete
MKGENKHQADLVSYIKGSLPMIKVVYIKNECPPSVQAKTKAIRMGLLPGTPDLMLLAPNGNLMFLELKDKGKKPRKNQVEVMEMLNSYGFKSEWSDEFGLSKIKVLEWVNEWM